MGTSTDGKQEAAQRVLVCLCGECAHWEVAIWGEVGVFNVGVPVRLRCMTCKKEFPVEINIPVSDHLAWAAPKEVKVE
jgi:hypothetical protein